MAPETEYYYNLTVEDELGNRGWSGLGSFTTAAAVDIDPPVIGPVDIAVFETALGIDWTTDEPASTLVELGTSQSRLERVHEDAALVTEHAIRIDGLTDQTTYYFRVGGEDEAGNGPSWSDRFSRTTPDLTPPGRVTGVEVTESGDGYVALEWGASSAADLEHYIVYYDTASFSTPAGAAESMEAYATTAYVRGLSNDIRYYFALSAVDDAQNEGELSSIVSAMPSIPVLPGSISGYVTAASGGALEGVTVTVVQTQAVTTTDNNGYYICTDLDPGSYTLHFTREEYEDATLSELVVNSGQHLAGRDIVMEALPTTGAIEGVVRDEAGTPLEDVEVTVEEIPWRIDTDADGAYRFAGLSPASYTLNYRKRWYETATKEGVTVQVGATSYENVRLVYAPPSATVRGEVTDASDAPLLDVRVTIEQTGATATTDTRGRYIIADIEAGSYSLRFEKSGYTTVTRGISLTPGQSGYFTIEMARSAAATGVISGTVETPDGEPVRETVVRLTERDRSVSTDANGAFHFNYVEPGTVTVVVVVDEERYDALEETVAVVAGGTETLTLRLVGVVTTGAVRGLVTDKATGDPIAGVSVMLKTTSHYTRTAENGSYHLDEVTAGSYTLVCIAAGYRSATISGVVVEAAGTTSYDIVLDAEATAALATVPLVVGPITDDAQRAMIGVQVTITLAGENQSATDMRDNERTARTNASGYAVFPSVPRSWLGGTIRIRIEASGHEPLTMERPLVSGSGSGTGDANGTDRIELHDEDLVLETTPAADKGAAMPTDMWLLVALMAGVVVIVALLFTRRGRRFGLQ